MKQKYLFHGTSVEKIQSRIELFGGYFGGCAQNPERRGEDMSGRVTSTRPNLIVTFSYTKRAKERFDSGSLISNKKGWIKSCTPTILVVTSPANYKLSNKLPEEEIILYGIIKTEDFTTLDSDTDFIMNNFPDIIEKKTLADVLYVELLKLIVSWKITS
jgi:hypothetical protein